MLKFVLLSFLALPLNRVNIVDDIEFNNNLNNIVCSIGAVGYLIPKFLKKDEICETDDDCPLIMRCCQVATKKYCCTPNNFVKIDMAFSKQPIEST